MTQDMGIYTMLKELILHLSKKSALGWKVTSNGTGP